MQTKRCTECGEVKPISEFYKGYEYCKKCHGKKSLFYWRVRQDFKFPIPWPKGDLLNIKRCSTCKKIKGVVCFGVDKNGKIRSYCKKCACKYSSEWAKVNSEVVNKTHRVYRLNNPDKFKKWDREKTIKYKDKIKLRWKGWATQNKDKINGYNKNWRRENVIMVDGINYNKNTCIGDWKECVETAILLRRKSNNSKEVCNGQTTTHKLDGCREVSQGSRS